jgi:predicted lipid carrier protein YhbT
LRLHNDTILRHPTDSSLPEPFMPHRQPPHPLQPLKQLLDSLPSPRQVLKRIHPFLFRSVRFAPFSLQRRALEEIMQQTFAEAFDSGQLGFLQGRWLALEVRDLDLQWFITLGRNGLILVASPVVPDVTIRGDFSAFVSLANQEQDPDTLFFSRRLVIEGDTELGLAVKNLMFATEINGFPKFLSLALRQYLDYIET